LWARFIARESALRAESGMDSNSMFFRDADQMVAEGPIALWVFRALSSRPPLLQSMNGRKIEELGALKMASFETITFDDLRFDARRKKIAFTVITTAGGKTGGVLGNLPIARDDDKVPSDSAFARAAVKAFFRDLADSL
jgi:hypothetical protein